MSFSSSAKNSKKKLHKREKKEFQVSWHENSEQYKKLCLLILISLLLLSEKHWDTVLSLSLIMFNCHYFTHGSGGEVLSSAHLCVCLRAYLPNHIHNLYQFFMHVAYGHGSVLLQPGGANPRERGNFGGFRHHRQCIVWVIQGYEFRYKGMIWLKFTYLP